MLADQSSAGRPQAGDADVVQRSKSPSQIASVHARFRGFAHANTGRPPTRMQNPAVQIFGEYKCGAEPAPETIANLHYNAGQLTAFEKIPEQEKI